MTLEHTLSIIKPDAISKNLIGEIYQRFEEKNLKIVAAKMLKITEEKAKEFYSEHKSKDFFKSLVTFMSSGPIMVSVLEGKNAIEEHRTLMGATNPSKAAPGTLRALFASSIDHNAVHGSDSTTAAQREIACFFSPEEIYAQ